MAVISIKNLVHKYKTHNTLTEKIESFTALDEVSLDVNRGEFIAILGHNGSGKSTLARHINCLLFPTEGKVFVNEKDTSLEDNVLSIRAEAGMVFQNPDNQIIATVVEEDVAFGPENIGVEPSEIKIRVDEALKSVNMQNFLKSSPNRLSGGQKQRIAIAGVLAMRPQCIILDEPTAMLDPIGRREVLDTIKKLNKEAGMTVILVTHHMDEVVDADRVIIMKDGRIAENGTPRELITNVDRMKELSLDVPQVTEISYLICKNLPDFGISLTNAEFHRSMLMFKNVSDRLYRSMLPMRKKIDFFSKQKNGEPILSLSNVSYVYDENTVFSKKVLKNIKLDIYEKEYLAVIGHTGSGKSTLMQLLDSLIKPSDGRVFYHGEDVWAEGYDRRLIRNGVGLVFQYPDHQLFEMSVLKDVMFGPRNQGLDDGEAELRAKEALELVGVSESEWNKSPFDLSGGQKKRVTIAGVLAMKPEVIILDEPTAGLDPLGRDEILGAVYDIYEKIGISVVLVSHSMEDVAKYADRIVVMDDGSIIFDDLPVNVFNNEKKLERVGLSVPQINSALRSLAATDPYVDADVITTEAYINKAEILKEFR